MSFNTRARRRAGGCAGCRAGSCAGSCAGGCAGGCVGGRVDGSRGVSHIPFRGGVFRGGVFRGVLHIPFRGDVFRDVSHIPFHGGVLRGVSHFPFRDVSHADGRTGSRAGGCAGGYACLSCPLSSDGIFTSLFLCACTNEAIIEVCTRHSFIIVGIEI